MQQVRHRFRTLDKKKYGSLQSCIRTNDLESIGDGMHLTYFEMLGNFSFGRDDFEESVELWDCIIRDFSIPVTHVTVYPTRDDHRQMWLKRGYKVIDSDENKWSDGEIGGECCEIFMGQLEVGNLVNPMGHSSDVGFGWERMHQVIEKKDRVDETSLFDQSLDPMVRDHVRTLKVLQEQGIEPGAKGREYICRRLVRRILDFDPPGFDDWVKKERELRDDRLRHGRRSYKKFRDKSPEWWWETFGILPEEIVLLV